MSDPLRLLRVLVVAVVLVSACGSEESVVTQPALDESTDAPTADAPGEPDAEPGADAGATTAPPATAATESTTSTEGAANTTVTAAPSDLVKLVGGGQLDLNTIEGTDTVLWFWAPW